MTDRSKLLNDINNGNYWGAGVTFQRSNAVPLEKYSIFGSLEEAQNYVATNGVAYPGQIISVLDEDGDVRSYSIDGNGKLQLVSATTSCNADCYGLSLRGVHFVYNGYEFDTFGRFDGHSTDDAGNWRGEEASDGTVISNFNFDDADISGRPGWYYLTVNDTITEEVVNNLVGKTFGIYFRSNRYSGATVLSAHFDSIINDLDQNEQILIVETDNMFLPKNWNTKLKNETAWPLEKGYIYFRDFPAVGDVLISNATSVSGSSNTAILYGASAEGYSNISEGKYAHTEGRGNYASYCAHAEGNKNYAYGFNSHSQGYDCRNVAQTGHVGGYLSIAGCGWNRVVKPIDTPDAEAVDYVDYKWLHVEGDLSKSLKIDTDTIAIYDPINRLWQYSSSALLKNMSVYDTDDGKKTTKLTFSSAIFTSDFSDWLNWKIMFPKHPEIGDSGIETGAHKAAFAHGVDSMTLGYDSATFGSKNYNIGNYNFVAGWSSKSFGNNNVVLGKGLTAQADNQIVLGNYNVPDSTASFILGAGTSSSNPKNALVLKSDGLHTNLTGSGDTAVLNRSAVKSEIQSKANEIYADIEEELSELRSNNNELCEELGDILLAVNPTYLQQPGYVNPNKNLSSDNAGPIEIAGVKNGLLKICEGEHPETATTDLITATNSDTYITLSTPTDSNNSVWSELDASLIRKTYHIDKRATGSGAIFTVKPSYRCFPYQSDSYHYTKTHFIFDTDLVINSIDGRAPVSPLQFTINSVSTSPILLLINISKGKNLSVSLNGKVYSDLTADVGDTLHLRLIYSVYENGELGQSILEPCTTLCINGETVGQTTNTFKSAMSLADVTSIAVSANNASLGSFTFNNVQCRIDNEYTDDGWGGSKQRQWAYYDSPTILWELPTAAYSAIEAIHHYSTGCTIDLIRNIYSYVDDSGNTVSTYVPELATITKSIATNKYSTTAYPVTVSGSVGYMHEGYKPTFCAAFIEKKPLKDLVVCTDSSDTPEITGSLKVGDELSAGNIISTASIKSISGHIKAISGDIIAEVGDITAAKGCITAQYFNALSDERLKDNFRPIQTSESILNLPIYEFDFKEGAKNQLGCKAQDLQKICPQIVHENEDGYLSIQESKIVYLLLDEIKKLNAKVSELSNKINC